MSDRIPPFYKMIRPWFARIVIVACIALLFGNAPWWVTAWSVVALLMQFFPDKRVHASS
jgi:hypothetical protein